MAKTKITEVSITSLRITAEDYWLERWIKTNGDSVARSPHYRYLQGKGEAMRSWMMSRSLEYDYLTEPMMQVLRSLIDEGQKEPIKIYKDMRINTGHKRAACLLFLGKETIKAEIVPDDYKL